VAKGIAVLMYLVASNVNAGNGAWILIECTGVSTQAAAARQSQHAVQVGEISGVIGQVRNLVTSVTAASTVATLTVD
jgi:hypothetical protein